MRNLLLLAFALGLAGAANAQSSQSTTNQFGSTNDADVTQTGGATSFVDQGASGAAVFGNDAVVNQSGANTSDGDQMGNVNDASVTQGTNTGIGFADIDGGPGASGNGPGVVTAGAVIAQGTDYAGEAYDSDATINQSGNGGRAAIYQGVGGGTSQVAVACGGLGRKREGLLISGSSEKGGFLMMSGLNCFIISRWV